MFENPLNSRPLPAFQTGMTLSKLYRLAIQALSAQISEAEAATQVRLLFLEYTGLKPYELSLNLSEPASQEFYLHLRNALEEIGSGKPLQYIIGHTEFYNLTLKLDSRVLIPRPETEELVRWILDDFKDRRTVLNTPKMLDLGTGSGAIALALKKNIQDSELFALDNSEAALTLARENACMNELEINFILHDMLCLNKFLEESAEDLFSPDSLDLIVSNPPYVTRSESALMHRNVLDFEPHAALFVSDETPLIFYKAIASYSASHLKKKGRLYLEINENFGSETTSILEAAGFSEVVLRTDLNGKNRMIRAEKK